MLYTLCGSVAVATEQPHVAQITLKYEPTVFGSLLGMKPYERYFVGQAPKWCEYPSLEPAYLHEERILTPIWEEFVERKSKV